MHGTIGRQARFFVGDHTASRPAAGFPSRWEVRRRVAPAAAKNKEQNSSQQSKKQSKALKTPPPPTKTSKAEVTEAAEDDEVIIGEDEDEDEGEDGFFVDEGEEGEELQEDFDAHELGLTEDDEQPGVSTGGTAWGEAALEATQKVLRAPALEGVELYLFRAVVPQKKLDIRLDRLSDIYGSPSIDDIEKFSRMLMLELEARLGAEAAGELSFEVSSPGAERQLALPGDLARFRELAMRVEYTDDKGSPVVQVLELTALDLEAGSSQWRLADVRANAPTKGRKLSKRQREQAWDIPLKALTRVRIHVDF